MIVTGQDFEVAKFVASRIDGCERGFENFKTLGIVDDEGQLIAGLVYHNWNPESAVIEISGAADNPRWLTRPVLHDMFSYPFQQIGVQMVVMRVSEKNKRLHRILKAYGFDDYRIPRLRGRNEAEMIYTLTDDAWRSSAFERKHYGQAQTAQAA